MIGIHEELCTVVFSTVSVYSLWFVLHWFTYGAAFLVAVIYISQEIHSKNEYQTPTANRVYFGLFFVYHLYLFILPCSLAAKITSSCAGKKTLCWKLEGLFSQKWGETERPWGRRCCINLVPRLFLEFKMAARGRPCQTADHMTLN